MSILLNGKIFYRSRNNVIRSGMWIAKNLVLRLYLHKEKRWQALECQKNITEWNLTLHWGPGRPLLIVQGLIDDQIAARSLRAYGRCRGQGRKGPVSDSQSRFICRVFLARDSGNALLLECSRYASSNDRFIMFKPPLPPPLSVSPRGADRVRVFLDD